MIDANVEHRIEIPSGKDSDYENFPVGSWLLPARLRPHIKVFYSFARAIDDIADASFLKPEEKLCRLDGFAVALKNGHAPDGYEKAAQMLNSLSDTGVDVSHCLDLIDAFKQDAVKNRYENWQELLEYCRRSASPVGRYLLDLHGVSRDFYPTSDALCNALQVINHLQDVKDDFQQLDRVYLPREWFQGANVDLNDLSGPASTPGLRTVFDRALDQVARLLGDAEGLTRIRESRRLALEAAVILSIARGLLRKLSTFDPLARRIVLSKPELIICSIRGLIWWLFDGCLSNTAKVQR